MSIKRKCENCANVKYCRHIQEEEFTCYCDKYKYFTPTEKLIRRDERAKIKDKIVNDYLRYKSIYILNKDDEEIRKIYEPITHILLDYIRFLNDLGMEK